MWAQAGSGPDSGQHLDLALRGEGGGARPSGSLATRVGWSRPSWQTEKCFKKRMLLECVCSLSRGLCRTAQKVGPSELRSQPGRKTLFYMRHWKGKERKNVKLSRTLCCLFGFGVED